MEIRTANREDLSGLLKLYTHLHDNPMPVMDQGLATLWDRMLANPDCYVVIGTVENEIVSSCVLFVAPNLTHEQRPWAVIENVVTHALYRNRGCATRILAYAGEIAERNRCYKIMLMTGSKEEGTLRFYERAGYNRQDKTAFIRWL